MILLPFESIYDFTQMPPPPHMVYTRSVTDMPKVDIGCIGSFEQNVGSQNINICGVGSHLRKKR